jgi:hypothetical protein
MPRFTTQFIAILAIGLPFAARESTWADTPTPDSPASQPSVQFDSMTDPDNRMLEHNLNKKLPKVELPAYPLSGAFDFLRDVTALNFYVDWKTLALAGVTPQMRVTVSEQYIPTRQALTEILSATGSDALEFHLVQGAVLVSTKLDFEDRKKRIGPYLRIFSAAAGPARDMNKRLPRVEMPFPSTLPAVPFVDAIDWLRDVSNVNILVKWDVLKAAGIPRTAPISLQLQNVRFSTILWLMLDQAGDQKLGYVTEMTEMTFKNHKEKRTLVIISTVDDLMAAKGATTQPQ